MVLQSWLRVNAGGARSREAREETAARPSDIAQKRGSNTRKILPRPRLYRGTVPLYVL